MKSWAIILILAAGWGLCLPAAVGQPNTPNGPAYVTVNAFPNLTFEDPTCLLPVPGTNQLLVAGRQGELWTFVNSAATTTKTLLLDLRAHCQGWSDSGVLGVAFHPQFGQAGSPNRGYIYVWYCYTPGPLVGSAAAPPNYQTPCFDRLSRFTIPDGSSVADPNSEYVMINQFDRDLWHNGGAMFFGPDGYLYVTNGDEGGVAEQYGMSQKVNVGLFGGVLRIDVDQNLTRSHAIRRQPLPDPGATVPAGWPSTFTQGYTIPNDNPFVDPTGKTLEEFYALGFRSPHRMTYDPGSGQVWIGDVGQDKYEEVDLLVKGGNYEWGFKEGFHPGPVAAPATLIGVDSPPIYEYPHGNYNGCVIGGYVYRGAKFASAFGGQYIFGDYNSGRIWSMSYNGGGTPVLNLIARIPQRFGEIGGLASFGLDASGELYMLTLGPQGVIYTLSAPGTGGHLVNLSTRASAGTGQQALAAGFITQGSGSKQFLVRGVGPALSQFGVTGYLADPMAQLFAGTALQAQDNHWCSNGQESAIASAEASCGAFALPVGSNDSALVATVTSGNHVLQVTPNTGATGIGLAEIYDLTPAAAASSGPQLINLSARATVGTGIGNLVGGFVIGGNAPMTVLIRGIGPGLSGFNITGYLPDPVLTLFDSQGDTLATNTIWQSVSGNAISAVTSSVNAFPLANGSADSALLVTLAPGSYSAQVSSAGGNTGVGLVEIYAVP